MRLRRGFAGEFDFEFLKHRQTAAQVLGRDSTSPFSQPATPFGLWMSRRTYSDSAGCSSSDHPASRRGAFAIAAEVQVTGIRTRRQHDFTLRL